MTKTLIKHKDMRAPTTISANETRIGEWFYGNIQGYAGVFVRSFDEIMFVESPRTTWSINRNVLIDCYEPIDTVEITIS